MDYFSLILYCYNNSTVIIKSKSFWKNKIIEVQKDKILKLGYFTLRYTKKLINNKILLKQITIIHFNYYSGNIKS